MANVGLLLGHRRRLWTNIKPTLAQHLVLAGMLAFLIPPADTKRWTNVGLMLDQRHKRWANIKAILCLLSCTIYHFEPQSRLW